MYLCLARQLLQLGIYFGLVQACNAVLCISLSLAFSALAFIDIEGTPLSTLGYIAGLIWGLLLSCFAEMDWLLARDATTRSKFLRKEFSGRLLDAGCSSASDKENIHQEVLQSGKLGEVEAAVNVLLRMNTVTAELQRTAAVVGELGDVTRFSRFWMTVGLFAWMVLPTFLNVEFLAEQLNARSLAIALIVVMPLQGGLWLLGFILLPPGRRKFAAVSLQLWMLGLLALMTLPLFFPEDSVRAWYAIIGGFFVGPLCLILLLAGPYRTACVPFVGPPVVRWMLGSRCCCCGRRAPWATEAAQAPLAQPPSADAADACPPYASVQATPLPADGLFDVTVEETHFSF